MVERAAASSRRRLRAHPVVWAVPLMVLVAFVAHPLNDHYYDSMVNFDPQGEEQLYEWQRTTLIFRYTTGLLFGQVLALLVGAVLARRHRLAVALAIAAPLAAALAAATFAVGQLMGPYGTKMSIPYAPLDDPLFVRMVVRELVAYPLYGWAGVGLGALLRNWIRPKALTFLVLPAWTVATLTGLWQNGSGAAPHWLYWAVPPIGAATAVALSGLSLGDGPTGPVLYGDWGNEASFALLVGAALYALVLNLLAVTVTPSRDHLPASESDSQPRNPP